MQERRYVLLVAFVRMHSLSFNEKIVYNKPTCIVFVYYRYGEKCYGANSRIYQQLSAA